MKALAGRIATDLGAADPAGAAAFAANAGAFGTRVDELIRGSLRSRRRTAASGSP